MAPALEARQTCYGYGYGRCNYYGSRWNDWGRWVLLGAIILFALLVFFFCGCCGARKRRKQGAMPMYGTGWLAPKPPQGHGQMNYYGPGGSNAQPQNEPNTNTYGNNNSGAAYGQQQAPAYESGAAGGYYNQAQGVEMQAPQNTYQPPGGSNVYAAPPGPPPNKY